MLRVSFTVERIEFETAQQASVAARGRSAAKSDVRIERATRIAAPNLPEFVAVREAVRGP